LWSRTLTIKLEKLNGRMEATREHLELPAKVKYSTFSVDQLLSASAETPTSTEKL
jgi:hypothetical protein